MLIRSKIEMIPMTKTFLALTLAFLLTSSPTYAQSGLDVGVHASVGSLGADGSLKATVTSTTTSERMSLLKNALGAEIRSSADVATDDDLDAYEENLLAIDARLTDADSSNSRVAVAYKHHGRLLWLFPVTIESRTTIEIGTEDTLTIGTKAPWWSGLVADYGGIREQVELELMADGTFTTNVLASEDPKARAAALEAMAAAHARAAANTDA